MNATHLFGLGAIALAGAAFAQTVPQEAWVGAPIATTASAASRAEVSAGLGAVMRIAARTPQELRVGAPDAPVGALERAEVLADLRLWRRAGLDSSGEQTALDPSTADGRRRIALYQQWRAGPAYAMELARIKGAAAPAIAGAQGDRSGSN